ncbi:MAG TPA: cation diffusion facilitator family transporter [Micromonosporaceae bacterium]
MAELPTAEQPEQSESLRTVIVALAINVAIALAKAFAAVVSGSSALLAEAAHSVADTGNEIFLLVALRSSARPADETHPFGYGADRFFWSLLAAFGIFVAGGLTAIVEGIYQLLHPHELGAVWVGYAVLVVSLALELTSWRTAFHQLRAEARGRGVGLRLYLRRSSDPTPTTVFYEDTAAVIGIALAAVGLALHQVTGSAVPDAAASIAIGVLLVCVAVRLASRERELLTNQAAPDLITDGFRQVFADKPEVERVARLDVVVVGPRMWLITADVVLGAAVGDDAVIEIVGDLRRSLRRDPGVVSVYLTPVSA